MKTIVNKLVTGEKGQAMILALILLVVGALILAPLLGFMGTGLTAGKTFETKTDELYAADAGVENALWKLENDPPAAYPYSLPMPNVNSKGVAVIIDDIAGSSAYKVTSTAGGTTIIAYVSFYTTLPGGSELDDDDPDGNYYVTGNLKLDGGPFTGNFIVEGNLELDGNNITGIVCVAGNLDLDGGTITGDVYAGGTISGYGAINGTTNPYADCPLSVDDDILTWEIS